MTYKTDDIEIFIMTHNRADYLIQAIQSILNQTVGVQTLTVLDNESTDATAEVVKSFESRGVKYIKTFGFLGNYYKAKEIASKKYILTFHDDDILHPKFLELALLALNKYENVSLITTKYREFFEDNVIAFDSDITQEHHLFHSQKEFSKYLYFIGKIAYSSAIYRTEDFKNTPLEYEKYNKFNDWPFMVKMSGHGKTILFDSTKLLLVRRHKNQDTWTSVNSPTLEQLGNLDTCFKNAINPSSILTLDSIMYNSKCIQWLGHKYDAYLSDENKEKYKINDLLKLTKNNRLKLFVVKLISILFGTKILKSLVYSPYVKNIRLGNKIETL